MAVYPFMFASKKDFEPIVEEMDKVETKPSFFITVPMTRRHHPSKTKHRRKD